MPVAGLYLITAAGALLALFAPLELAFSAVVGAWLLLPAGLILPGFLHILLVDRIVLAAFVLRLVLRSGKPGEPAAAAYRLTPLHLALGAFLAVGYVDGVVLAPGSIHDNLVVWLTLVDDVAVFVVALAVVRTVGVWRLLRTVAVLLGAAVAIGIIERVVGSGWANYLQEHVPIAYRSTFVFPLATRGNAVRSQGAAEFALEYGWVLTVLVPVIVVAVGAWMRRNASWGPRRLLLVLVPVGMVVAVALSASRSAEVALAAGGILLVVLSGAPRRLTLAVGSAIVLVALVGLAAPSLVGSPFSAAAHTTSISSRTARLPDLFALVVGRPLLGLGYTGYSTVLIGADDAYALTYSQLGVLGVLAWVAVLVTALATAGRALRVPRRSVERELAAACIIGILGIAVAAASYDLTFTEQSMWALSILGAVSVVLAERVPARHARSPARLLWPAAGVLAGAFVLALAPLGFSRTFTVYVMSPGQLATETTGVNGLVANIMASTVCGFLDTSAEQQSGTTLRCAQGSAVEHLVWPAQVTVRIGGDDAASVEAESRHAFATFHALRFPVVAPDAPVQSGKPAWATTAPVSGAVAGTIAAFLVPPLRRRRAGVLRPAPALST